MTLNTLTNGGFESGDFTGWSIDNSEFNAYTEVSTLYANDSTYGAKVSTSVNYGYPASEDWVSIDQPLTLDQDVISISFDIKKLSGQTYDCKISCKLRQNEDMLYEIWSVTQPATTAEDESFTSVTITKQDILDAGVTLAYVDLIKFIKETQ